MSLPAGGPVLVDIEGINTDPSRHTAPYALNPNRRHLPDLTFGDGPHAGLGAQLALLEASVLVRNDEQDGSDLAGLAGNAWYARPADFDACGLPDSTGPERAGARLSSATTGAGESDDLNTPI